MGKHPRPPHLRVSKYTRLSTLLKFALTCAAIGSIWFSLSHSQHTFSRIPINAFQLQEKCRVLHLRPGPPKDFYKRESSDRFVHGTKPVLIRNATLWTGENKGKDVVIQGSVVLHNGIIKHVGKVEERHLNEFRDLVVLDAKGAWVTPGVVDLHSHMGVYSSPALKGAQDVDSHKGPALPWLRSLDGLNTHDDSMQLAVAGGITTAIILPGSESAIGGQAFTIKLRPTEERTPGSLLLEPPFSLEPQLHANETMLRWRQMKHACGETPSQTYAGTRMDTIWALREAYNTARKIRDSQDAFCAKVEGGRWSALAPDESFPEDLQWEALVDVLRGRVKVHIHSYEAVDLDALVRLTNEFEFPIAALHHAHEAYLVTETLKKTYGPPPAVAMFASLSRYKREAYRGSNFAPRIVADAGLPVVIKSDHPLTNSRHLVYQAQLAHYYGLSTYLALSSVITTPAEVMGMDHRIGYLRKGYDADIVIWDSHPLSLSSTPTQVFIDGVPQLNPGYSIKKPESSQKPPITPDFDKETNQTLQFDGLPPLAPNVHENQTIAFTNMSHVWIARGNKIIDLLHGSDIVGDNMVLVSNGKITCVGPCSEALPTNVTWINLEGGTISPGLVSFGSPLGLVHIGGEPSTTDGAAPNHLSGGSHSIIDAADGLQFASVHAQLAYRSGVTYGVTAPISNGLVAGISTAFSTGAQHKLSPGAHVQRHVGLHVKVGHDSSTSVSTQIGVLRSLFKGEAGEGRLSKEFQRAAKGITPILVAVENADIMATLISLKTEIEEMYSSSIRMAFVGASEAHVLAKEIGRANIGVILIGLTYYQPFPATWDSRRILAGLPLSSQSALQVLRAENVTVAYGVSDPSQSEHIGIQIGWSALENSLSEEDAFALTTVNLEQLLGIDNSELDWGDSVAVKYGSVLDFQGKVTAVISPHRKIVDIFS